MEYKLKEAIIEKFKDKFKGEVTIWQPPIGSFLKMLLGLADSKFWGREFDICAPLYEIVPL